MKFKKPRILTQDDSAYVIKRNYVKDHSGYYVFAKLSDPLPWERKKKSRKNVVS